jgi:uncharacterized membrane protein
LEFAEFFVLGLVLATAVGTGAALGAIAHFRLERYRKVLIAQDARIAELEAQIAALPAQAMASMQAAARDAQMVPSAAPDVTPPAPTLSVVEPTPAPDPIPAPPAPEPVLAAAPPVEAVPAPELEPQEPEPEPAPEMLTTAPEPEVLAAQEPEIAPRNAPQLTPAQPPQSASPLLDPEPELPEAANEHGAEPEPLPAPGLAAMPARTYDPVLRMPVEDVASDPEPAEPEHVAPVADEALLDAEPELPFDAPPHVEAEAPATVAEPPPPERPVAEAEPVSAEPEPEPEQVTAVEAETVLAEAPVEAPAPEPVAAREIVPEPPSEPTPVLAPPPPEPPPAPVAMPPARPPLPPLPQHLPPRPMPLPEPAPALAPAAAASGAIVIDKTLLGWIGGGLIAIGVIAALLYANEAGRFGDVSQLLFGYLFGGGLLAGAEALRGRNLLEPPVDWQARHAPIILAAAGIICAFGITFVGYARLGLLAPAATLGIMGACALIASGLSLRYGQPLGWLALATGFAAPFLSGVVGASPPALFTYLFAMTAAALALAKHRQWRALGLAAVTIAAGWSVLWMSLYFLPSGVGAAAGYLVMLAALGVAFAWDDAATAVAFGPPVRVTWPLRTWLGMAAIALGGLALTTLSIKAGGAGTPAVNALILAVAMLAVAAAFREGFAPAAAVTAGLAVVALASWPPLQFADDVRAFLAVSGALGFAATVGGFLMMARNGAPACGALVTALVPTATLLIAYLRLGEVLQAPYLWGGMALFLAGCNGFWLDRISKAAGGASRAPGAATAFAAAAAACAVMAGAFAFDNARVAAGLAVLIIPLALLDRRLDIPALRFAGATVAALAVALLSPIALMRGPIEPTPIFNSLAPIFIVSMAALWGGARLFAVGPAGYSSRVTIFLRICLVALVFAFGFAEIRHLANRGDIGAPYVSLWENGGHTAFLLAIACGIAWRIGKADRPLLNWAEILAFGAATVHAMLFALVLMSPWWGVQPAPAPGPIFLNPLTAAYLLPALLFGLYAVLRARLGTSVRAHVAGAAALLCGLAWLLLETRHAFHPFTMASARILPLEHAAYSLVLLLAAGLCLLAAFRFVGGAAGLMLRGASAALAAVGLLKALAIDVGTISGPVRYLAYLLVAGAAVAAILGYHRYVFPRSASPSAPPREADGNLVPPAT